MDFFDDLGQATQIADTIRQAISAKRLRKKQSGEDIGCITVSMGVAQFRPGEALNALIKRADYGLYYAKYLGRNRVVAETELNAAADCGGRHRPAIVDLGRRCLSL